MNTARWLQEPSAMFKAKDAFSSYSIHDVSTALPFYRDILGLDVAERPADQLRHRDAVAATRREVHPHHSAARRHYVIASSCEAFATIRPAHIPSCERFASRDLLRGWRDPSSVASAPTRRSALSAA